MNIQPFVLQAEVLQPAVLTPEQMCSMNFARLEHDHLERIVRQIIIPMVAATRRNWAKRWIAIASRFGGSAAIFTGSIVTWARQQAKSTRGERV